MVYFVGDSLILALNSFKTAWSENDEYDNSVIFDIRMLKHFVFIKKNLSIQF